MRIVCVCMERMKVCVHEKLRSLIRFVICRSCDSIKDSSLFETTDDDLGMALKRFPSRNKPANALCLDDSSWQIHFYLMHWNWLEFFCTSFAYHEWKLFFKSSLIGLLTETSSGCSLSMQWAGTYTKTKLCSLSKDKNSDVVCPRKQSKIARAGYDLLSYRAALFA